MATPWPNTLPTTFEVQGYREILVDNTIRTEPDAGTVIARRQYTAAPVVIRGSMQLTATQKATLKAFYKQYQGQRWSWANDIVGATRYYLFAKAPEFSYLAWDRIRVELELLEFETEFAGS